MPIATPEIFADMLDRAKKGAFAYPAINVSSSQTITAAIRGFAECKQWTHKAIQLFCWAVISMNTDIYFVVLCDNVCVLRERYCAVNHVLNS